MKEDTLLNTHSTTKIWESKLFRVFALLLSAILLCLFLFAAAAALKYRSVARSGAEAELKSGPELLYGKEVPLLGQEVPVKTVFLAPWNQVPAGVTAEPGSGSQLLGEPVFRRGAFTWGGCFWTLDCKVQPYRIGEIGEGKIEVAFGGSEKGSRNFELNIPSFHVNPVETPDGDALLSAGYIERRSQWLNSRSVWIAAGILLIAAAAAGYLLLRRRKERMGQEEILTPWQSAIQAIRSLKENVDSGMASPEISLAKLADIVRRYLEKRFNMRAEHQTTAEFLSELDRDDSFLTGRHRHFLRDFLSSADMVKFARLPADKTLFETAADRAEKLVSETVPEETNGKERNE